MDGYSVNPKYLQFMMPDREITVVNQDVLETENLEAGTVILMHPETQKVVTDARLELKTSMLSVRYVEE